MPDPLAGLAQLEGVPSAVVSARDAVDVVLRDRGLRHVTAEQQAAALLDGARSSAALADDPERWLPGAVRLSTELMALSGFILSSPGQAMARAHALLAHGQVPEAELGRVRAAADVSERMAGLSRLLVKPTRASAVVLAAVVHAEVDTVRPFGSADGLVARALEHMVLIAKGVDPAAVIVVEAGHLEQQTTYRAALEGYRSGTVVGVRDWLLHCARALRYGAEASPLAVLPRRGPPRT